MVEVSRTLSRWGRAALAPALGLALIAAPGCADAGDTGPDGFTIIRAAAGPCVEHGNEDAQFPALSAVKVVIRIAGADGETVKSFTEAQTAGKGQVIVTGVTPGQYRRQFQPPEHPTTAARPKTEPGTLSEKA